MKKARLLDSFALLAYLKKENGYHKVKDILLFRHESNARVIMNAINVGEVYYILARERSVDAAEYFLNDILPALDIEIEDDTFSDVIAAAKIKAEFPIAYADAFAVATAMKHSAILATGDTDFRQVEHLIEVEWL